MITEGAELERRMPDDQRESWRHTLDMLRLLRPYADAYPTIVG